MKTREATRSQSGTNKVAYSFYLVELGVVQKRNLHKLQMLTSSPFFPQHCQNPGIAVIYSQKGNICSLFTNYPSAFDIQEYIFRIHFIIFPLYCIHFIIQYSTVQYRTVQYSTVQYSTVQHRKAQYSTVHYSTVICSVTYQGSFPKLIIFCRK